MFDGAFGDAPRRSSDDFLQELDQLLEGAVALEKIDDAHECGKQYLLSKFFVRRYRRSPLSFCSVMVLASFSSSLATRSPESEDAVCTGYTNTQ